MFRHLPSRLRVSGMLICLMATGGLLSGCSIGVPGNGVSKTEDRQVEDFDSVSLRGIGDVNISVGESKSVTVTIDENLMELVETVVEDGELVIRTTRSIAPKVNLKVEVKTPSLTGGRVSGVGDMNVENVSGDSVEFRVSGVGSLKAAGDATSVEVKVSGTGSADLSGLKAQDVLVRVSGTGNATVHATKSVDANVSGVGGIVVHGKPESVNKSVSGIGDVTIK